MGLEIGLGLGLVICLRYRVRLRLRFGLASGWVVATIESRDSGDASSGDESDGEDLGEMHFGAVSFLNASEGFVLG